MLENCKRLICSPSLNKVYCIVLYCIVLYCIVLYCIVITRVVSSQRQTGLVFAWSTFFIWSQELVKPTLRTREQAHQVPRLAARIQTSLKSYEKLRGGPFSPQDYIKKLCGLHGGTRCPGL